MGLTQTEAVAHPEVRAALEDVGARVRVIATVHNTFRCRATKGWRIVPSLAKRWEM